MPRNIPTTLTLASSQPSHFPLFQPARAQGAPPANPESGRPDQPAAARYHPTRATVRRWPGRSRASKNGEHAVNCYRKTSHGNSGSSWRTR